MPRPASKHPTELELDILKVLWAEGPCSVRDVRERLAPARDLAYTSVMTIMNIMTKKAYLRRSKSGNRYVYRACADAERTMRRMLGDVVDRVFDGSASQVILNLLETADLDDDELDRLKQTIERKKKEGST